MVPPWNHHNPSMGGGMVTAQYWAWRAAGTGKVPGHPVTGRARADREESRARQNPATGRGR